MWLARAFALVVVSAGVVGAEPPPLKLTIVAGSESSHRLHGKEKFYPWVQAEPGVKLVTNACGFAEITYRKPASEKRAERWKARALLSEKCDVIPFTATGRSLVAYMEWERKPFVSNLALIHTDDQGREYIDDPKFIRAVGLQTIVLEQGRVYLDDIAKNMRIE